MSPVLSRRLDPDLRPGAVDGLALVRVLNEDIGCDDGGEDRARRIAVTAMAGAMIRFTSRQRTLAMFKLQVLQGYRLTVLLGDLYEWVLDLHRSDQDPDADMLRVRLLQLQMEEAAARIPAAHDLAEAVRALVRVSLAGSRPVD